MAAKGGPRLAHHAIAYWLDQIEEQCRVNRSYAIAHGLV